MNPTDGFMIGEGRELIPSLLSAIFQETNLYKKLNMAHMIVNSIDDEIKQKIKSDDFKKVIEIYMSNVIFIKRLKLYCIISENTETALEYYGKDYLTHDEYMFDADLEKVLIILNRRINEFISILFKEYEIIHSFKI